LGSWRDFDGGLTANKASEEKKRERREARESKMIQGREGEEQGFSFFFLSRFFAPLAVPIAS
jgi:hypothetical protein